MAPTAVDRDQDRSSPGLVSISPEGRVGIDLYWLPLGAGGNFVRFNGYVYEAIKASLDRRPVCDLYHSALAWGWSSKALLAPAGLVAFECFAAKCARGATV